MRAIATKFVKEGDVIAKDIIGYDGGILLRSYTTFKEVYRARLLEKNIFEVYIEDELSKGIYVESILEPEIQTKICGDIKYQFKELEKNLRVDQETLEDTANLLIDQLANKETILELSDLKNNDNYTYEHCLSVAIMVNLVCNKLGMTMDMKQPIVMGALIHDIGKIIIPKNILNKKERLTDEEFEIIKSHAKLGYQMIKDNVGLNAITKLAILCHHEREDGSGYPLGKKEDLHIGAKIVAVCDVFHALISDRCYRQGLPISEAIAICNAQPLNKEIQTLVQELFSYYPVGSTVIMSDGRLGLIEKNFAADVRRPLVRIIEKQANGKYTATGSINLMNETDIFIVSKYDKPL